jgi:hypothetical protein
MLSGMYGLRGLLPSHHPLAVQSKPRWVPGADRNLSPEHNEKQGAEKESLVCSQLAIRYTCKKMCDGELCFY